MARTLLFLLNPMHEGRHDWDEHPSSFVPRSLAYCWPIETGQQDIH